MPGPGLANTSQSSQGFPTRSCFSLSQPCCSLCMPLTPPTPLSPKSAAAWCLQSHPE